MHFNPGAPTRRYCKGHHMTHTWERARAKAALRAEMRGGIAPSSKMIATWGLRIGFSEVDVILGEIEGEK